MTIGKADPFPRPPRVQQQVLPATSRRASRPLPSLPDDLAQLGLDDDHFHDAEVHHAEGLPSYGDSIQGGLGQEEEQVEEEAEAPRVSAIGR